jgi:hypothetical protein
MDVVCTVADIPRNGSSLKSASTRSPSPIPPRTSEGLSRPGERMGRDRVRRVLRELENAGYLTRARAKKLDGRWAWRVELSETGIFLGRGGYQGFDGMPGSSSMKNEAWSLFTHSVAFHSSEVTIN